MGRRFTQMDSDGLFLWDADGLIYNPGNLRSSASYFIFHNRKNSIFYNTGSSLLFSCRPGSGPCR